MKGLRAYTRGRLCKCQPGAIIILPRILFTQFSLFSSVNWFAELLLMTNLQISLYLYYHFQLAERNGAGANVTRVRPFVSCRVKLESNIRIGD